MLPQVGNGTMRDFVIPVDAAGSFNTGLALVNLGQGVQSELRPVRHRGAVVENRETEPRSRP